MMVDREQKEGLEVLEVFMMVEREWRVGRWLNKGLALDPLRGDFLHLK